MANFDIYTNYNTQLHSSILSIIFGRDLPLLEVELNEMQRILLDHFTDLTDCILTTGFVSKDKVSVTGSTLTLQAGCCIKLPNRALICNRNLLTINLPTNVGNSLYMHIRQQIVTDTSTLYVDGNEAGTVTPNYLRDTRIDTEFGTSVPSSQRLEVSVLFDTNATKTDYLSYLVGTVTSTGFNFSSFLCSLSPNIKAENILQTGSLRMVSDSDISSWNSKLNSSDVATTPTANKVLKLNAESKLPASITGDSASVGGATLDDASASNAYKLWSSSKIASELGKKQSTILSGSAVPASSLGNVGDVYIQLT